MKTLTKLQEFQDLKKWDKVICSFFRDVWCDIRKRRFWKFKIVENKEYSKEIILEKKDNIYFNYEMFLNWESNLKEILK